MNKSFASNIKTDLSYNLDKHIQYKHVLNLFQEGFIHQHTAIALYRLDRNKKLLEIFTCPSNNRVFYGPELNL